MIKYNDNELLYLAQENDDLAKEVLIDKYKALILSNISKLNLGQDEKDEFFQEGLISLVSAIDTYDEKYYFSFNGYFQLILKRKFIDLLKAKNKKNRIVYLENLDEYIVDTNRYSDKQMLKEDELKLSELETEIYLLRFINEFKPKEIAIKLNLNIKQVYDAIDRIRKKARKKY